MSKEKKYQPHQLDEFIYEETICQVTCNKCRDIKDSGMDAYWFAEEIFKQGCRATKNNVYCPECSKKLIVNPQA